MMNRGVAVNQQKSYLQVIQELVRDVKYGTVSIILQDGKVVQVEQNKKIRFTH